MLSLAVIVFAIAAVGGLILALHVLRDRFAPWSLSVLHALLGAAGLVLVLLAVVGDEGGSLIVGSLLTLVLAALGGFFLVSFHARKKLPPKGIVILHALLAVVGFGLLVIGVFAP
jgi:hypothetical protein